MRSARPEDSEVIAALIRSAFAAIPGPLVPLPSALRVTAADVAAHLETGGGVVVDPARACLLWTAKDGALYCSRLAVAPEARRAGLATALLMAAEQEACRIGLDRMTVSTRLALEGNRRLFERFGFVETGRSAHPGYAEPTMVSFEKRMIDGDRSA